MAASLKPFLILMGWAASGLAAADIHDSALAQRYGAGAERFRAEGGGGGEHRTVEKARAPRFHLQDEAPPIQLRFGNDEPAPVHDAIGLERAQQRDRQHCRHLQAALAERGGLPNQLNCD